MNLHHDKDAFEELVTAASVELKIPAPIIEKDYYVTLALKEMTAHISKSDSLFLSLYFTITITSLYSTVHNA